MAISFPTSERIGRLPWFVRFPLGCTLAVGAIELTSSIAPLRSFPLLLSFPTVILAAWFLGMWGAAGCALMDVALVDAFLTRSQFRFSNGNVSQELRMGMFLTDDAAPWMVSAATGATESRAGKSGTEAATETGRIGTAAGRRARPRGRTAALSRQRAAGGPEGQRDGPMGVGSGKGSCSSLR